MSEKDTLTGLTTLQYVELGVGIPAGILTIMDVLVNNAAVLTWIWTALWSFMSLNVKFWHVLLIGASIALGRYLFTSEEEPSTTENDEKEPEWKDYTSDHIKEVLWRWNWSGEHAVGVEPHCPECKTRMVVESSPPEVSEAGFSAQTECPNCDFSKLWRESNPKQPVARIIERNAREGEYEIEASD
jgi:hypothetical protein